MINKIIFVGHLGRDPEVRYLSDGKAVASFSVASSEKWKDKAGNQQEATEWLRCSAFDRLAEVCGEYLKKGSLVYVEGALKTREYTDKDGVTKYSTECRVRDMKMLGGKQERGDGEPRQASKPAVKRAPQSSGFDDMDDSVPF